MDRAGLVGEDGPTHHGTFDLTYLREIPNLKIMAPADENELRQMLYTAVLKMDGPVAIRYPRGTGPGVEIKKEFYEIPAGKVDIIQSGEEIAFLAIGRMVMIAKEVAQRIEKELKIHPTIINTRFIKPLPEEDIKTIVNNHDLLITMEDNSLIGGFGGAVAEYLKDQSIEKNLYRIGIPDRFVTHGSVPELFSSLGMDADSIFEKVLLQIKQITGQR